MIQFPRHFASYQKLVFATSFLLQYGYHYNKSPYANIRLSLLLVISLSSCWKGSCHPHPVSFYSFPLCAPLQLISFHRFVDNGSICRQIHIHTPTTQSKKIIKSASYKDFFVIKLVLELLTVVYFHSPSPSRSNRTGEQQLSENFHAGTQQKKYLSAFQLSLSSPSRKQKLPLWVRSVCEAKKMKEFRLMAITEKNWELYGQKAFCWEN